jgi:hypothetical protein
MKFPAERLDATMAKTQLKRFATVEVRLTNFAIAFSSVYFLFFRNLCTNYRH